MREIGANESHEKIPLRERSVRVSCCLTFADISLNERYV